MQFHFSTPRLDVTFFILSSTVINSTFNFSVLIEIVDTIKLDEPTSTKLVHIIQSILCFGNKKEFVRPKPTW